MTNIFHFRLFINVLPNINDFVVNLRELIYLRGDSVYVALNSSPPLIGAQEPIWRWRLWFWRTFMDEWHNLMGWSPFGGFWSGVPRPAGVCRGGTCPRREIPLTFAAVCAVNGQRRELAPPNFAVCETQMDTRITIGDLPFFAYFLGAFRSW